MSVCFKINFGLWQNSVICNLTFIIKRLKKSYTDTKFYRDPFRNFRVNIHHRNKSHDLHITCSFAHFFVCKKVLLFHVG
jgi:hypothetical protein